MAVNKVIYGSQTLIDLTGDTVTENDVALGKVFHKKDGSRAVGNLKVFLDYPNDYNGDYSRQRSGTLNIAQNGIYDVSGYLMANVNVSGGGEPALQHKTVTPTKSTQNVMPDSGYDGLSNVTVDQIPEQYITTTDATAVEADIAKGKTAYVAGKK